jgi:hypothetical protein
MSSLALWVVVVFSGNLPGFELVLVPEASADINEDTNECCCIS